MDRRAANNSGSDYTRISRLALSDHENGNSAFREKERIFESMLRAYITDAEAMRMLGTPRVSQSRQRFPAPAAVANQQAQATNARAQAQATAFRLMVH